MKAPDIYTELVITNFLENNIKKKKRQGKLLAQVALCHGGRTKKHIQGQQLCTHPPFLPAGTASKASLTKTAKQQVQFVQQPAKTKRTKRHVLLKQWCVCGGGRKQNVSTRRTTKSDNCTLAQNAVASSPPPFPS